MTNAPTRTDHAFTTELHRDDLFAAIKRIPPGCGHHVLDNGDGTVILSVWSVATA